MAKIEKLTFDDLENQSKTTPIWVINTTHNVANVSQHGDAMGEVIIQMKDQHGRSVKPGLTIWKSWLPVCVSRVFPRRHLLSSIEFRRAVDSGLITPISEKSAKLLEATEGAAEEREHLRMEQEALRQAGAARGISGDATILTGDKDIDRGEAEVHDTRESIDDSSTAEIFSGPTEDVAPGISPNFNAWVQRLQEMPEMRALNAMKTRQKFTMAELNFIKANVTGKPKLQAQVKASIERRRNKNRS